MRRGPGIRLDRDEFLVAISDQLSLSLRSLTVVELSPSLCAKADSQRETRLKWALD
jgi:hypothetical protein